jgi:hypothetical protein
VCIPIDEMLPLSVISMVCKLKQENAIAIWKMNKNTWSNAFGRNALFRPIRILLAPNITEISLAIAPESHQLFLAKQQAALEGHRRSISQYCRSAYPFTSLAFVAYIPSANDKRTTASFDDLKEKHGYKTRKYP